MLHPILIELQADACRWYELETRRYYVNIYCRGGNLMEIRQLSDRADEDTSP